MFSGNKLTFITPGNSGKSLDKLMPQRFTGNTNYSQRIWTKETSKAFVTDKIDYLGSGKTRFLLVYFLAVI